MALRHAGKVDYPTRDGRPMGETDLHRDCMVDQIQALQRRYEGRDDVYVTGNLLLFYEEGHRRKHLSPDVMVVFGVPAGRRDNYLLWEEKPPTVVIEVTSKTTRQEDVGKKKDLYLQIGVREFYMFDPTGDYLNPRLCGFHNINQVWVPVAGTRLYSPALDLHLQMIAGELRLIDRLSGETLPTTREIMGRREAETRLVADAVLRAEAEATRAEAEASRAEAEASRAAAAEEEIARLRRRLEELGG